ncbi:HTH_Tnp_Tc3_2 domain-containing protein [Trichonephila clavipes]|nr:HTH_Tnp_Tc3_2 domain-containing protein [Trichonephila clavipes]
MSIVRVQVGKNLRDDESYWSARQVARHLTHSDFIVRRFGDQWTEETSFTRRRGSGCPPQTSNLEDHHIIQNSRVEPTASLAIVQTLAAPSLRAPVSSQTIARCLAERHLVSRQPLRVLPMTPNHPSTLSFLGVSRTTGLDCNGMEPGHLQR